ncbi:hypothetical protein DSL72_004776 [Monilinia vaccinii-corymbosi]|uniref:Flagellar FliJ protein n=1 Tax=Monilinia vaccinii-corymbosi TaxID=61207 RepID=A0A8A3P319_9HELO|nr:hypothetical protein DSL72_004776 [Monilinia vaccinii-corymbosi]
MTRSSRQVMQERDSYLQKGGAALERQQQRYKSMEEDRDRFTQQYAHEKQQRTQEKDANLYPHSGNPQHENHQSLEEWVQDSRAQCEMMKKQMQILRLAYRRRLRKFEREIARAEKAEGKANIAALAALSLQDDGDAMEE